MYIRSAGTAPSLHLFHAIAARGAVRGAWPGTFNPAAFRSANMQRLEPPPWTPWRSQPGTYLSTQPRSRGVAGIEDLL